MVLPFLQILYLILTLCLPPISVTDIHFDQTLKIKPKHLHLLLNLLPHIFIDKSLQKSHTLIVTVLRLFVKPNLIQL